MFLWVFLRCKDHRAVFLSLSAWITHNKCGPCLQLQAVTVLDLLSVSSSFLGLMDTPTLPVHASLLLFIPSALHVSDVWSSPTLALQPGQLLARSVHQKMVCVCPMWLNVFGAWSSLRLLQAFIFGELLKSEAPLYLVVFICCGISAYESGKLRFSCMKPLSGGSVH